MERFISPERMGTKREKSKKTFRKEIDSYYEDKYQPEITNEELTGKSEEVEDNNEEQEVVPKGLVSTDTFFQENGDDFSEQIHNWYENAMSRRNRESLGYGRFRYHFFEGGSYDLTYMFGDKKRGFLLGYVKYGVFIPTHFAPKSIRTGYELMKELGGNNKIPVVMSITPDLVQTISKMPEWHTTDLNFLSNFQEEQVKKIIVYNSHPDVSHLMWGLVKEYLNERDNDYDNYEDQKD